MYIVYMSVCLVGGVIYALELSVYTYLYMEHLLDQSKPVYCCMNVHVYTCIRS